MFITKNLERKKEVLYTTLYIIYVLTYLAKTSKFAISVFPEKNPPLNESCCHWPLVSKKGERLKPLLLYSKHRHKHSFKNKRMGSITYLIYKVTDRTYFSTLVFSEAINKNNKTK